MCVIAFRREEKGGRIGKKFQEFGKKNTEIKDFRGYLIGGGGRGNLRIFP
jgi:hypothetical protein